MHTGHDDLLDAASIWQALPLRRELHRGWWNEPRLDLASEQERYRWLNRINIDAWIHEQGDMTARAEETSDSQVAAPAGA